MAQLQSGKYSIAWFKLAEFVVRKEKERALSIYRLLAHSLHDDALSCQLEGDLLLSFNDTVKALDLYIRAAQLYEANQRFMQAAAVYEHIITLMADQQLAIEYIFKLVELYVKINNTIKITTALFILADTLIKDDLFDQLEQILHNSLLTDEQKYKVGEFALTKLIEKKPHVESCLLALLDYCLAYCIALNDDEKLSTLLTKLHLLSPELFTYAQAYTLKMSKRP